MEKKEVSKVKIHGIIKMSQNICQLENNSQN
jgi:hypothetical protein